MTQQGYDISNDLIKISDSANVNTYVLHSTKEGYSCVDGFKMYGGPLQPFEYITMTVSKKRIAIVAPMVMYDIRAGMNTITVYGFGLNGAQFTVTSCKTNDSEWEITAYSAAEVIRGNTLVNDSCIAPNSAEEQDGKSFLGDRPSTTVENMILSEKSANITAIAESQYKVLNVVELFKNEYDHFSNVVFFKSGDSIWTVLSVCALKLNCSMWVSGNTIYLIDLSIPSHLSEGITSRALGPDAVPWEFNDLSTVFLNSEGMYPYNPSEDQLRILNNVLGTPEPGQEGRTLVLNRAQVNIDQARDTNVPQDGVRDASGNLTLSRGQVLSYIPLENGKAIDHTDNNPELSKSLKTFGSLQYDVTLDYLSREDAQDIANAIVEKFCDSEQSISFTMREVMVTAEESQRPVCTWTPAFGHTTRIATIVDYTNDLIVSAKSNLLPGVTRMLKGALSYWVRNFPEHTTTYTFGEIAPTDFSQSYSVIRTALNSR